MTENPALEPESRKLSRKMILHTSSAIVAPKIVVNGFGGQRTQGKALKTNMMNRKMGNILNLCSSLHAIFADLRVVFR